MNSEPAVRQAALKAAKSSDPERCSYGLVALQHLETDAEVTKLLSRSVKSNSTRVRAAAAWTIGMARIGDCRADLEAVLTRESNGDLKALLNRSLEVLTAVEQNEREKKIRKLIADLHGRIKDFVSMR